MSLFGYISGFIPESIIGKKDISFERSPHEILLSLGFESEDAAFLLDCGYDISGIQARLAQQFTPTEIVNAVKVKNLHDRVEIAAYQALQEGIALLQLVKGNEETAITSSNSRYLLHVCVRKAAHQEMRSPEGYVSRRGDFLNQKQFLPVIGRVNEIVSDRDAKLTRATYTTIEDIIANLDAHNSFVNAILFNAWGVPEREGYDHIAEIKRIAGLSW